MDALGKSPVPPPILVAGKLAMLGCVVFFFLKGSVAESLLFDSALTQGLGMLLAVSGVVFVILGFVFLGGSISVGLPREETIFKTEGVFRVTRNPLYLGAFLGCVGSCFYTAHPVNFLLCVAAIVIHHRIVLKEEQFLESRFGQQWREYKQHVPRYLWKA
jgi:protein-S-isoprenylcysteine O-methyltransferase Ste14